MAAAARGHEATVRLLLASGADVNAAKTEYGETALFLASREGHEATVRLLLASGADVHVVERKYGETALTVASKRGHEKIVRLLRDNEAHHKEQRVEWGTALAAISMGDDEAAVRLLTMGITK